MVKPRKIGSASGPTTLQRTPPADVSPDPQEQDTPEKEIRPPKPPRLKSPKSFAVRMHRPDPRAKLVEFAKTFLVKETNLPQMALDGYTMVYGPVADLAPKDLSLRENSSMWRSARVHSWNPKVVSFFGKLAIAAAHKTGKPIFFVLKHAPGYGSLTDTSEGNLFPPVNQRSETDIARDFSPFRSLFEEFGPEHVGVMVGGVIVPAIDEEKKPAVFSPKTVSWIRRELGPKGANAVLISDAINNAIFNSYYEREPETGFPTKKTWKFIHQSLAESDVDIMLYHYTPSLKEFQICLQAAVELVGEGSVTRTQLERSIRRILKAKQSLFPNLVQLKDIDKVIQSMSIEKLIAQKIIFSGASPGVHSTSEQIKYIEKFARLGVGGVSIEGTERLIGRIQPEIQSLDKEGLIPPFLANNSPDEFAYNQLSVVRAITRLLEKTYSQEIPDDLFNAVFDEVMQ